MITTIFFDLGNVLINFSHQVLVENIEKITEKTRDEIEILLKTFSSWDMYELGLISTGDFFTAFKQHFQTEVSNNAIASACCKIFSPNPLCIQLLKKTYKKKYKLGLISNTCFLHYEYLQNNFPIFDFFNTTILSYELQLKKPNIEIFKFALSSIDSSPQNCIFIDDLENHVKAALSCGIQGIVFKNASLLEKEFSLLGIEL